MKILYFGSACDKEWFDIVSKIKAKPYNVAQYRFETALLEGFASIEAIDMKIFYLYQESYYPNGNYLWFKSRVKKLNNRYNVSYISGINLPIIKELYYFLCGLLLTLEWSIKNRLEPDKVILTPFQYTPLSLGIFLSAKILKIKRINIFTDLSADIMNEYRQKDMIWLKRVILPYYKKLIHGLEKSYDMYVLFTEAMNKKVNQLNKSYLIMEGIFNNDLDLTTLEKTKAIMYAGTLSFEYGIKLFLDAFEQIKDDDLQLWLFGDGDMREYIKELCSRDSRITFFGFRPHEEVFEYEKRATLLINTRNPEDRYTKYSFPSKIFEYMVSGTPFLTTRIDGIPDEYYPYLYVIEDYSVESVKQKIAEVLTKSSSELNEIGNNARQFVLENKNCKIQAKKICDACNEIQSKINVKNGH